VTFYDDLLDLSGTWSLYGDLQLSLILIWQVQSANNKITVEISLVSLRLVDRKSDAAIPIAPNVEAGVNAKVEQLAHVLEITLIVVPDKGNLLILNLKLFNRCKLKLTKIPTRTELIQVKTNPASIFLGSYSAKAGEKIEAYQMCLLVSKK
jgi:hypothetical protein